MSNKFFRHNSSGELSSCHKVMLLVNFKTVQALIFPYLLGYVKSYS